ncbi:hypothetical protein [Sphingobacterium griseoflavum]|uniref:YtkA-like domain-containing protein n=1 Tax=Sphingobacterium griseoflavum TaxID=1474952 RepID=A0ABQ3HWV7_9SPHI|nr:hypothetical protein [Sphingobacterium griseoflavum]GHE33921.1 hypothetical protein GCM10017764_16500 [Sphingobacterium griseoflavum]
MKLLMMTSAILCMAISSCTKDKTDYKAEIDTAVTEHLQFKEAARFVKDGYTIRINTLNGTFYKGYNEVRVTLEQGSSAVQPEEVYCLPIFTDAQAQQTTGPHGYKLQQQVDSGYFSSYIVFTEESQVGGEWQLYMRFSIGGTTYRLNEPVQVVQQANKNLNMTRFTGSDGELYVIALISPQKPRIAENQLVAGIYRFNRAIGTPAPAEFPDPEQFSYEVVQGYTLKLDPRMPEPSMGNHSSPNNEDLNQRDDGRYYGVVNYTMTGNWTLNFILLNQLGEAVKGTVVPNDFTPGVNGVKSELYLDILF